MNIIFPIVKIVVHKGHIQDDVFIFSGVRTPAGDYVSIQVPCPKDEGEKWVFQTFKTMNFETVFQGMEVCAPG